MGIEAMAFAYFILWFALLCFWQRYFGVYASEQQTTQVQRHYLAEDRLTTSPSLSLPFFLLSRFPPSSPPVFFCSISSLVLSGFRVSPPEKLQS